MKLAIGDRVETPEGPGTVVGTREWANKFGRYQRERRNRGVFVYVLVEPDGGPHVRQWRSDQLRPLSLNQETCLDCDGAGCDSCASTKAENQAEALYIERQQEAKHDLETGYELDDPKHPTWAERQIDKADAERKREKEEGL